MQLFREKRSGNDKAVLDKIRAGIKKLLPPAIGGYQYTGTVYREIAMQNSDFGGMENVGNTTITANRIIPFPQISDGAYEYMIGVKVHEFYHNLNGSEVTGKTPFELWLNEAVTVLIETRYMAFLSGEVYTRLKTVLNLLAPAGGTLALDAGAASMPIEPEGFNDPNDLITNITYVKGPEFVGMVETVVGKELFVKGLDVYHKRYRHANATWQQWIGAMEEVSGKKLLGMAEIWLHQKRYPDIRIREEYDTDTRSFTLFLTQSGFGTGVPWTFPFKAALVDAEGRDIVERTFILSKEKEDFTFPSVEKPAFVSLNRGYSCYGKLFTQTDDDVLYLQACKRHRSRWKISGILPACRPGKNEHPQVRDPGAFPEFHGPLHVPDPGRGTHGCSRRAVPYDFRRGRRRQVCPPLYGSLPGPQEDVQGIGRYVSGTAHGYLQFIFPGYTWQIRPGRPIYPGSSGAR